MSEWILFFPLYHSCLGHTCILLPANKKNQDFPIFIYKAFSSRIEIRKFPHPSKLSLIMFAVTDLNKTSHIQGHLQKTNQKEDGWMDESAKRVGTLQDNFYDQDNGVHTINPWTKFNQTASSMRKLKLTLKGFSKKKPYYLSSRRGWLLPPNVKN